MKKSFWKKCKQTIKKLDYFGVQFFFHYKDYKKYQSVIGGLTFVIYILLSIIYVSININGFINRKNLNIIFYDKQIDITNPIQFSNYSSIFSFGVECDDLSSNSIFDYISLELNYVILNKTEGIYLKKKYPILSGLCTKSDFFNEFNSSFEYNNLGKYYCPKEKDYIMAGTYINDLFTYYEFTLSLKDDDQLLYENLTSILQNHECKYQIFYIDTTIDVNDYQNPIKKSIKNDFLVLKPDEIVKMNIFFKTKTFDSYENYLFDKSNKKYYIGFSSNQLYSIKKGYNRVNNHLIDYDILAKIYLRSALSETVIERKYMKLTEFAANMSSLFSTILLILYIIFSTINEFNANLTIMNYIFQFQIDKTLKSNDTLKLLQKKFCSFEFLIDKNQELKINSILNPKLKNKSNSNINISCFKKNKNNENKFIENKNLENKNSFNSNLKMISDDLMSPCHLKLLHKNFRKLTFIKNNEQIYNSSKKSISSLTKNLNDKREKNKRSLDNRKKRKRNVNFHYNCIEILFYLICPCFSWKQLKVKNSLIKKGEEKLYLQLDILSYIRRMQQLELLNYILLEPGENIMLDFLSKPSISLANQVDIHQKIYLQYQKYIPYFEIDDFTNYYKILMKKNDKNNIEKRLLNIATIQLNNIIKEEINKST